nr:MAG TPA: hypothetical protein [Caudoviricetes sp.]
MFGHPGVALLTIQSRILTAYHLRRDKIWEAYPSSL